MLFRSGNLRPSSHSRKGENESIVVGLIVYWDILDGNKEDSFKEFVASSYNHDNKCDAGCLERENWGGKPIVTCSYRTSYIYLLRL